MHDHRHDHDPTARIDITRLVEEHTGRGVRRARRQDHPAPAADEAARRARLAADVRRRKAAKIARRRNR